MMIRKPISDPEFDDDFLNIRELDDAASIGAPVKDQHWGLRHMRIAYPLADQTLGGSDLPRAVYFQRHGTSMARYSLHFHSNPEMPVTIVPAAPYASAFNVRKALDETLESCVRNGISVPSIDEIEAEGLGLCREFAESPETVEAFELLANDVETKFHSADVRHSPDGRISGVIVAEAFGLFDVSGTGCLDLECGQQIRRPPGSLWFSTVFGAGELERLGLARANDLSVGHMWSLLSGCWRIGDFGKTLRLRDGRTVAFDLSLGRLVNAS